MTKNAADAEDLAQQTLLKAFAHLDQFRFEANFTTWLTRIAINELRSIHRKPIRRMIRAMDIRALEDLAVASHNDSPAILYERLECAHNLHTALDSMSQMHQVVIRLRDLSGLTLQDTAKSLSVSVAAAKTRHYRARERLRLLLGRT